MQQPQRLYIVIANCSEMEKLHAIVLCFLMLAPITFQCVKGETFFIVTTSESPCFESGSNESSHGSGHPENVDGSSFEESPCLTLQQFVKRFTNDSYQNLTNITLELDSGEHGLDSTLSIFSIILFTMISDTAATIICSQPSARLQLHFIEDVIMNGITFVGCKEIEISFVDQFRFENSSFQSSPNGSLVPNHITNITVTGSSFIEISQRQCDKAALIINNSSVLVQHCIFSNSQTCIYSTLSALTIDSCVFVNNSLMGCDIYHKTSMVTVINGPLTSKLVTVTNCDFIDNLKVRIPNIFEPYGAILFINGPTLVLNNSFVNNNGVFKLLHINTEHSQIIMDHNNFSDNQLFPAAIYVDANNVSITMSRNNFTDNIAAAVLLHVSDSTVTVNDSNFSRNNEAVVIGPFEYDDRECSLNVSVVIARCTFVHSHQPYVNLFQGTLSMCMDTGLVSVVQSKFVDNLSEDAAVLAIDTNSTVVIDSCTFIGNKGHEGGAVYVSHASSILINCTNFINNQGGMEGGGALTLDVENAVIVINEGYFYGNLNTKSVDEHLFYYDYAGTIYLDGRHNSLIIDKSSFINNAANTIKGGTLYVSGSQTGSVVIFRSNFTNNTMSESPYSRRILISSDTVKIVETAFLNNSRGECGALSMQAHEIHINNSYFAHNNALCYSGGAICTFQELNRMLISNSTFSHNYAKKDGGVLKMMNYIYDGRTTIDINGSTFINNRADLQGGVFWTVPIGAFHISNSLFIKNQAGSDGGITAMNIQEYYYSEMNSQLVISGSSFEQNRARARGGVFSSFTTYTYLIDNSSFTGNQARTDGGVMYVGSSDSRVRIGHRSDGSKFNFNNATDRGGVISINGSRLEISNTTVFNDNFAAIGDDIIACNCDISAAAFTLHSYTDPSFPNCTLYGHYEVTTTDSHPIKPTGYYVVAMAISIPIAFIMILLLLTATVLACLCFRERCLVKQYGVRRSDHPDFVPLMNNT